MTGDANGPLEGIKVLDWTMWQFGPVASSMLGDMGADVIKIEALDGDVGRALATFNSSMVTLEGGRNAYFETCNRNKRGLAVDLKTEEGKEIAYKLVKEADVFIENFRNGVAERLGMDYETLKKINPRLIYGSASGFGSKGPDAHLPSLDGCGQARAGLMMSATPPGAEHPNKVAAAVSDQIGGITLCLGVLGALMARVRDGVGQKVEVSHLSSTMWLQGLFVGMSLLGGAYSSVVERTKPRNPMANLYQCKEGAWIQVMNPQPARYWLDFVKAMGLDYLLEDPVLGDPNQIGDHGPELVVILDKQFATKTFKEWDAIFRELGFIYAKVQSVGELKDDPQVIANDYITDFNHPALGPIQMCNFPVTFSETPASIRREAPELGQHTEAILVDELGYDWDDITRFQDAGAIL
ncbi:MAG: CoA transferase [Chloroflexi bacterium]|nr:CoA transferase [Chloroflexota bacterium]MDA1227158.1 CoA transferase [Chloroflexota bacterium]